MSFVARLFSFLSPERAEELERLVQAMPEEPGTRIAVDGAPPLSEAERIDAHIRRFMLAIEQNVKGTEREAELRANLEKWQAKKVALLLEKGSA